MTWAEYEKRNREASQAYNREFCPVCHGIPTSGHGYFEHRDGRVCEACKPTPIKETA